MIAKRSLRTSFLIYLTFFALIIVTLGAIDTYRIASNEIKTQLLQRAKLLTSAIHHSSMIANNQYKLEHVVGQVMVENPEIISLIVLSKKDPRTVYELHTKNFSSKLASYLKTEGIIKLNSNLTQASFLDDKQMLVVVPTAMNQVVNPVDHSNHKAHHANTQTVINTGTSDPNIHSMHTTPIGAVLIAFDQSAVSKGINPILWRILPTSLVGICMMLILCYVLLHLQVIKPIGGIRKAMIKQQSGDQEARAKAQSSIEIDDVAISLNSMLDTIKARESVIKNMAMTDPLTGLGNRSKFHSKLTLAIQNASEADTKFAVLYIDLDKFKAVNDTHGHQVGDDVLKSVSLVLQEQTRSYDTVARLGGDEFAIIAIGIFDVESIKSRLINIIENISNTSYECDENINISIGASIGIAFYPKDATKDDDLIAKADAALYSAKREGRGIYRIYDKQKCA